MDIVFPLGSYHTDEGMSQCGMNRISKAAEILQSDSQQLAVISGGVLNYGARDAHHPHVLRELLNLGVARDRVVLVLDEATHTVNEAAMLAASLNDKPLQSLTVVTSLVHYPRAPYIFAHFFPLSLLKFSLVANGLEKDGLLFARKKEHDAYHQLQVQRGVYVQNGEFIETTFEQSAFDELVQQRISIEPES